MDKFVDVMAAIALIALAMFLLACTYFMIFDPSRLS